MSHAEALRFVDYLREPVSTGVLAALARMPASRTPVVTLASDSPWVLVYLGPEVKGQVPQGLFEPELMVHRKTGGVYEVRTDGTAGKLLA